MVIPACPHHISTDFSLGSHCSILFLLIYLNDLSETLSAHKTIAVISLHMRHHDPYEDWEKQTRQDAFVHPPWLILGNHYTELTNKSTSTPSAQLAKPNQQPSTPSTPTLHTRSLIHQPALSTTQHNRMAQALALAQHKACVWQNETEMYRV
jgi:hypothetical protein